MSSKPMEPKIIDVRLDSAQSDTISTASLRSLIIQGLSEPVGKKSLPTILLYDERGLRLYDDITTGAEEYYLFPTEEGILKAKGQEIVKAMHGEKGIDDGEVVLELGAGALRKTSHILCSLGSLVKEDKKSLDTASNLVPPITYYALDLEQAELVRTLNQITMDRRKTGGNVGDNAHMEDYGALGAELQGKVAVRGMWGTYDGGIQFIHQGGLQKLRTADEAEVSAPTDADHEIRDGGECAPSDMGDSSPPSKSSGTNSPSHYTATTPPSPVSSFPELSGMESQTQPSPPLHILFLGSSLGNFSRTDMVQFLKQLPLRPGSGDTLLIGLDGHNDKELIELAYNDPKGITKAFIMNGLKAAGKALGNGSLFTESKWEYVNFYNENERRHEAYYKSIGEQKLTIPPSEGQSAEAIVEFADGELLNIEYSHKYSREDVVSLFSDSNLRIIQEWKDPYGLYRLALLERPPFHFPLVREPASSSVTFDPSKLLDSPSPSLSPYSIPTIEDWKQIWSAWDTITLGMIPPSMLHEKPIDLRHKCLFYLGHIPTFLDIHLSKLLQEPNTEPEKYKYIFERGIDPHVDDPAQCHPHSEVPEKDEDWPTLEEILDFRDRVRQRVLKLYNDIKTGKYPLDRKTARVLFMTLEHEAFHTETLLYMLIQRAGTGTLPPPNFIRPQFEALSKVWDEEYTAFYNSSFGSTVTIGPQAVTIGHDDLETDDDTKPFDPAHEFGWDNENPRREVEVPQLKISWRPVTNGEYYSHWSNPSKNQGNDKVKMPASWVERDGEILVRTLYGPVKFDVAKHWPVQTDYDDLSTYARIKGGRIPTVAELAAFSELYENGFVGRANVGFRNWHPTPATTGVLDGGKGHNGGLWEWTSTVLGEYDGFIPSELYPGYSADFFDQKHQIVVGGSYATITRQAQRRSLVNYYQHNYPYAWTTARIVYDI